MTTAYKFKAGYTKLGIATTPSAAPTIDVMNVAAGTLLVTAGTSTAGTAIPGFYSYTYNGAASLDVVGLFHTTDTSMDQQDLFSIDIDAVVLASVTLGSGANAWTYNLKDNLGANVADADIWVTSDIGGATILANGRTDASGNVTFYLDSGTVYVWGQKSGLNFVNPDLEVVP